MYCSNCGTQLADGVNFCPNCGTQVKSVIPTGASGAVQDNMVMILSRGACPRATAAALLQQICGYAADEALLIVDSAPITVARGLNDAQARLLAQAFAEYGMEVSIYDGEGWRDLESSATSVWDQAGSLVAGVASALGLLSLNNRITRDMMHRWDYPYRYSGARPPVYRLHNTLRVAQPRRVAPAPVRPPVHRAPPPPRPAPAARPAPPPRPAAPSRPAVPPRPNGPAPHPGGNGIPGGRSGGGRNGGGTPGGRPGGGLGRRG